MTQKRSKNLGSKGGSSDKISSKISHKISVQNGDIQKNLLNEDFKKF